MKHYFLFTGKGYSKCEICGKVIFDEGDDSANAICLVKYQEREELRKLLEETPDINFIQK